MERTKRAYQLSAGLIWALHIFGLLGLFWPPMNVWLQKISAFDSFLSLTPLNLLLTGGLLLFFNEGWNYAKIAWVLGSMALGFGIEVAGVHTGMIFGEYAYGGVLGWKLAEVPLLIGVNWMILTYASGTIFSHLNVGIHTKALLMASLLTALDVLIEPVAIYWDFWHWVSPTVPLQNYIAWWLLAWLLSWWWLKIFGKTKNQLSIHVFSAQILFFAVNNILILAQ